MRKTTHHSTIDASTGIIAGKDAVGLDIDAEKSKWITEFGHDEGEMLAKKAQAAMADYEYLWKYRLH